MTSAAPDQDAADVTAVLAAHRLGADGNCSCGERIGWRNAPWLSTHEAHLTAALLASEPYTRGAAAVEAVARVGVERDALAAAVGRVRRRHPRGDEESNYLAPGLWCPTCGHERKDGGLGGCPDRNALIIPGLPLRPDDAEGVRRG